MFWVLVFTAACGDTGNTPPEGGTQSATESGLTSTTSGGPDPTTTTSTTTPGPADSSSSSGSVSEGPAPDLPDVDPSDGHVLDGLVAGIPFDEADGDIAADAVGDHDGTVAGTFSWEGENVFHSLGPPYGWTSIPRGTLLDSGWTVDMWLSAEDSGQAGAGRVLSATNDLGGAGPEWFFRNGLLVAMRINNQGATWDEPTVGSRSSPAPPDHWALPTTPLTASTLHHYVVSHDATEQRVVAWLAADGDADLQVVFDGTYSGTYAITTGEIRLGRSNGDDDRNFEGRFFQLLVYDRPLTAAEAEQNHDAGPQSL